MLPQDEKNYSLTLLEDNSSNENKEQPPIPHQEVDLAEKTEDELCTNTEAGEAFEVWSIWVSIKLLCVRVLTCFTFSFSIAKAL